MEHLRILVDDAFERRGELSPGNVPHELAVALDDCLELLDSGRARVAEPGDGGWRVNEWLKKAVLLYFGMSANRRIEGGFTDYYDKVPLKFAGRSEQDLASGGVGYATSGGFVDPIRDQIDAWASRIIAGEITVPSTP